MCVFSCFPCYVYNVKPAHSAAVVYIYIYTLFPILTRMAVVYGIARVRRNGVSIRNLSVANNNKNNNSTNHNQLIGST